LSTIGSIAESGPIPAVHLLNYRQSRYAQRLYQSPQNSAGSEIREGKLQLAETLRKASQLQNEIKIERVCNQEGLKLKSEIVVVNSKDEKRISLELV
jgi:hypothetical protein